MSIPTRAVSMQDLKQVDRAIRVCIYGKAGAGKTELAASFPRPMIIFDFDQKYGHLMGQSGISILSYTVDDLSQYSAVFTRFNREFMEVKKDEAVKTLVIDSLTALDTLCLKHFTVLSGKSPEEGATLPVYKDQSGWYLTFLDSTLKSVSNQLGKNVVVTAHESYDVDEESGVHSIQPLITGNAVLRKLPQMFEELWYIERKGGKDDERILHFKPYQKAIATSTRLKGEAIVLPALGKSPSAFELIVKRMEKKA